MTASDGERTGKLRELARRAVDAWPEPTDRQIARAVQILNGAN